MSSPSSNTRKVNFSKFTTAVNLPKFVDNQLSFFATAQVAIILACIASVLVRTKSFSANEELFLHSGRAKIGVRAKKSGGQGGEMSTCTTTECLSL